MSDRAPTVLFLCVHNADRSQMALGLFRYGASAWFGRRRTRGRDQPAA